MDIDWNKYMKDHHIKIYTEEELKSMRIKATIKRATGFLKRHKKDILAGMARLHASET